MVIFSHRYQRFVSTKDVVSYRVMRFCVWDVVDNRSWNVPILRIVVAKKKKTFSLPELNLPGPIPGNADRICWKPRGDTYL